MKKKVLAIILMVIMAVGMIGCTKTKCDWCGIEGRCKTYKNALLGEMDICSDCAKDLGID